MTCRRYQVAGRRQNNDMPSFPFKDGSGAIVRECRRIFPDRRINSVHGEWIKEIVVG